MEIWKDIIGYEGVYQVSDLGNVKSLFKWRGIKERILKPAIDKKGYYRIDLCKNGIRKPKKIHQLVAVSFLNHNPCGLELVVNHINFIKTDNRLENLEIITNRENCNLKHIKSSSEFVGVHWYKTYSKWRSSIQIDGKQKHLGYFENEIDAHNAYQKALKELKC